MMMKYTSLSTASLDTVYSFSAIDAIGTPLQGILRAYKDVKVVLYISLISLLGRMLPNRLYSC